MYKNQKSALPERFFSSATFFLVILLLPLHIQAANKKSNCTVSNYDASVKLKYVIDGDTIVLTSGEKVRLIGLDSPEIGHGKKADKLGALDARNYLLSLIKPHEKLLLLYGREQRDKYNRHLAHLFLLDGTSVQTSILANGYALPLTIPPNLALLACYRYSSEKAYKSRLGI